MHPSSYPIHPFLRHLLLSSGSPRVHKLRIGVNNPFDRAFLLEMRDSASCERTVDLHSVDQSRCGDHSVGRDFLHDLVTAGEKSSARMRGEKGGGKAYKIGLSRTTALFDLSLTFPFDHFFFLLRRELALTAADHPPSTALWYSCKDSWTTRHATMLPRPK